MNDIIVGVDRSETARVAAERGADLARAFDVNLHLVMCADRRDSTTIAVGGDTFHTDWVTEARLALNDIASGLEYDQVTVIVEEGDPAKALCDVADRLEARAIVVGNRRVKGASRILGSVAVDVVRQANCDVVVASTSR